MQRLFTRIIPLLFIIIAFGGTFRSYAQCNAFISNLPDTIPACKNTTVQLNAQIGGIYNRSLDTVWSPAAGLTSTTIINPIAAVGTTSAQYKLTVHTLTANNYVVNGDFSSGNTGFTTSYTLGTGGTWGLLSNEGTYGVSSNPNLLHSNFSSFYDHTLGTSSGSMLVVNGASAANTSIWCQTITVTPNTDYDFSCWGASTTSSSPAILQFSINGNLLGTPLSLPSTTSQWVQFHALWNSGSNTSITICIVDQQTAASGNDFAIDDIEFRQKCTLTDSVYIRVTNLQPAINVVQKLGCLNDTVQLTAVNNGGDAPSQYIWDFGDGFGDIVQNPTHVYGAQGVYKIKLVTKKNGCADSATIITDTRHNVSAGITSDVDTICAGGAVNFKNTDVASTNLSFWWDFGDGTPIDNSPNPSHAYATAGTYTVTHVATDQIPCTDTARKTIIVQPGPTVTFSLSDTLICAGQTIQMSSTETPGYTQLTWNFGDNDSIHGIDKMAHAYDKGGLYTVHLRVDYPVCPSANLSKDVTVMNIPLVSLGPDTSLCPYSDPVPLVNITSDPTATYLWNTGETGTSILAKQVGIYWLKATNSLGCSAADSVEIFKNCYLDMPNVFTPNGDGINDYFFPRQLLSSKVIQFHMQIFDRWGESIFETSALDGRGWDGRFNDKPQPQGVYIYMIEATIQGLSPQKYQGNVTLIR
ncbi:PKD domain-containing protein [Chitinophagaceae bacterium MMS25-I14]